MWLAANPHKVASLLLHSGLGEDRRLPENCHRRFSGNDQSDGVFLSAQIASVPCNRLMDALNTL